MRRLSKQLVGVGVLLVCASGCGDQVVIAREVLAQDVSREELDAGLDASGSTPHASLSHGSGQLVGHLPPKFGVPHPAEASDHNGTGGSSSESSTPDASHSAAPSKSSPHH